MSLLGLAVFAALFVPASALEAAAQRFARYRAESGKHGEARAQ